mmetsp:Transcript_46174/g.112842  ORF Transcript_46174/g.112842 Transcript_46174/m.112842 type:complete len:342 (+) Transcript_46174:71-1096(+)
MSSCKKRARTEDEDVHRESNTTKAYKYVASSKIWVGGRLVDRPSTYPTSYGVLFYRRRRLRHVVGGGSSGNDHQQQLQHYEFQYLLGLIPQRNFWTVFKGMSETADSNGESESPFETAIREFEEESSLQFPYKYNNNADDEDEDEDEDDGDKAHEGKKKQSYDNNDEDRRRCASDFVKEIWPPPEPTTKTTGSVPFLSTVLHGVTSRRKLLEIYLLPDPDESIVTTECDNSDGTNCPATPPTGTLDISKFDVDKVVKIDGEYMKGRPEIVQLAWLTKRQAVDDGTAAVPSSSTNSKNDTKPSKSKPIKIYNSQISMIERADELLQRHYGYINSGTASKSSS